MASLRAEYVHAADTASAQGFSYELPNVTETPSTQERVTHLAVLRSSTGKLQNDINTFLTDKMEKDAVSTGSKSNDNLNEKKEEENYGEEVVEDDA